MRRLGKSVLWDPQFLRGLRLGEWAQASGSDPALRCPQPEDPATGPHGGVRRRRVLVQLVLPCRAVNEERPRALGDAADEDMKTPSRQVDMQSCRGEVVSIAFIGCAGKYIEQVNRPASANVR